MDIGGQLTFNDSPLISKFNKFITYICKSEFEKALEIMDDILKTNSDFPGLIEAIKSVKFWQNRWIKIMREPVGKEQADILISEWANYRNYIKTFQNIDKVENTFIALKNLIYKKILKNLIYAFQNSEVPNIELLKKIGEIFLEIDETEKAIETLEYARMFRKKDSVILAMLAEAYSRDGNQDKSLLFFREAFFYEPQQIDLAILKSDSIKRLIEEIKTDGIGEKVLAEWIPIYGALLNIFIIKRELTFEEIERIIQETEELEKEYHSRQYNNEIIMPRLINRYFWIIDYYKMQSPNREYTKIYLNKLRELNSVIYQRYVKVLNLT